jgi:hypothetical protein
MWPYIRKRAPLPKEPKYGTSFTDTAHTAPGMFVVSPHVSLNGSATFTIPAAIAKRSFQLGEWVLVPRTTTFLKRSPHAHLERGQERVRLRHCSADMEQFALAMTLIAAAFSRRLDDILNTRTL